MGYGVALIRASFSLSNIPEHVRLSDIGKTLKAERIAGIMLLISAGIDGALSVDFSFFSGIHALNILTIGHALLLPMLSITVIMVSLSTAPIVYEASNKAEKENTTEEAKSKHHNPLTNDEVKTIANKIDTLLTTKDVFLDPDLTLDRIARKACIPARQISTAINQIYGRNISQVVNEYRIERAKKLLVTSDKTITQIYLDSGFQTKSNFNREFTRITQQTPSAFRRDNPAKSNHKRSNVIEQ